MYTHSTVNFLVLFHDLKDSVICYLILKVVARSRCFFVVHACRVDFMVCTFLDVLFIFLHEFDDCGTVK